MSREKLLRKLSSIQFAMWEMRIYLDTHPDDCQAKKSFNSYRDKYTPLLEEYEEKYGPLTLNGANSDEWLKDPWPWD